jgi:hypothetical protein
MAEFKLNVPNKNISTMYGDFAPDVMNGFQKKIDSVKQKYGNIIEQASINSNVPKELIIAMILALSNGENNTPYKSNDKLVRSGLFSLSNKTAKQILAREKAEGRLSDKEIRMLSEADPKVGLYISDDKGAKTFNFHWKADYNLGLDRIKDEMNKWDLTNAKLSIPIGTIWIGQLWDKFSTQTLNPIDKVIITALLPYDDKGWMSGNEFAKAKSWNTDYTEKENWASLPKPATDSAMSNIINPNKGYIGESLKNILNRNGYLYLQTKKS